MRPSWTWPLSKSARFAVSSGASLSALARRIAVLARVYDAILGGRDNFAVDREVAAAAVKTMGDAGNGARLNRAALG
jgi:S-adenosyl methyltransferase